MQETQNGKIELRRNEITNKRESKSKHLHIVVQTTMSVLWMDFGLSARDRNSHISHLNLIDNSVVSFLWNMFSFVFCLFGNL